MTWKTLGTEIRFIQRHNTPVLHCTSVSLPVLHSHHFQIQQLFLYKSLNSFCFWTTGFCCCSLFVPTRIFTTDYGGSGSKPALFLLGEVVRHGRNLGSRPFSETPTCKSARLMRAVGGRMCIRNLVSLVTDVDYASNEVWTAELAGSLWGNEVRVRFCRRVFSLMLRRAMLRFEELSFGKINALRLWG